MNVAGTCYIDADPARVWAGLMNPELLALCIPGCQQMEATGDGAYAMKLKVGVGAVSGTYTGTVRIADVDEPRSFRLVGEGKAPRRYRLRFPGSSPSPPRARARGCRWMARPWWRESSLASASALSAAPPTC